MSTTPGAIYSNINAYIEPYSFSGENQNVPSCYFILMSTEKWSALLCMASLNFFSLPQSYLSLSSMPLLFFVFPTRLWCYSTRPFLPEAAADIPRLAVLSGDLLFQGTLYSLTRCHCSPRSLIDTAIQLPQRGISASFSFSLF